MEIYKGKYINHQQISFSLYLLSMESEAQLVSNYSNVSYMLFINYLKINTIYIWTIYISLFLYNQTLTV